MKTLRLWCVICLALAGCHARERRLLEFAEEAVGAIVADPNATPRYATGDGNEGIARYRSRMTGSFQMAGCRDDHDEYVCTVAFDDGSVFWLILADVDGSLRITGVQPIDLDEGRVTN